MKTVYVLDACSLIALLNNEAGANVVIDVLNEAQAKNVNVFMHKINLLEVYYDIFRRCGEVDADKTLEAIEDSPIIVQPEVTIDIFKEARRLKATYKISLADSIALAVASVEKGALLTSDHHEFDIIEKQESKKLILLGFDNYGRAAI